MLLGEILVAHGLADPADIERAFQRQRQLGGWLGDNLLALGVITAEQLEMIIHEAPQSPRSVADSGVNAGILQRLVLKAMYVSACETVSDLISGLKLPYAVIYPLLQDAVEKKLAATLGASALRTSAELRYALTELGRKWAEDALVQNQYIGPAPVSLAAYTQQIMRNRLTNERIDRARIQDSFADLVVADDFADKLGPAINSGRAILLYGSPGNGKSLVAERIGQSFQDIIYIPYCIEVEGQIIKVFDRNIHARAVDEEIAGVVPKAESLMRTDEFDKRWVACRRPVITTGGELTLDMLDLQFDAHSKFYEAPLHVKALGGIFVIDDFGRQTVQPKELLNRWIVPLERRTDYLKLHTGSGFSIPFDQLLIFSTNMAPDELMDAAFLRRIPYKFQIDGPTEAIWRRIFERAAGERGLEDAEAMASFALDELRRHGIALARYQPKFVIEQVIAACRYAGAAPRITRELVLDALRNLYTDAVRRSAGGAPEDGTVSAAA